MFKKKQVLIVISIAVTCFLIGTMFNVMASDGGGSPWDKVWTVISGLESRVETLEGQLPQQGFLTAPAYDSGWVDVIPAFHYFEHSLGTTEVFVYLQGHFWRDGVLSIENHGEFDWMWLNTTHISVHPGHDVDQIRVMIWKISEP